MSRMIDCTGDILTDLYEDEEWSTIIKHRNHVRIPERNPIKTTNADYIKDQPDNIWEIIDRDGVVVHDSDSFVKSAIDNPDVVIARPNDIYVFEQDVKKANSNSEKYGTLSLSSSNASTKTLKRHWKYPAICGDEYSWSRFLENLYKRNVPPMNSLLIVDRYLFSYNGEFNADYKNGIRNVYDILDALLPKTFSGEFHVLIVFDETTISRNHNFNDIVRGLQQVKKALARPYFPTIELLSITKDTSGFIYSETHNRRIISNYFIITAEHGLSAFVPEESGMSDCVNKGKKYASFSQDITFDAIYSGIDNEDQDTNAFPVIGCDHIITSIREALKDAKQNPLGFKYSCNGNIHLPLTNLKNRLVCI